MRFEEQIKSKDNYPWIFPSFSWGIFFHLTRFDQSRTSENILWIIIANIEAS